MPITAAELLFKLSVVAAAGNTTAGTPATSLGDQVSTTQITDATVGNIYDNISGDENAGSVIDYRCIFVHNVHGSLTLENPRIWISAEVAGGASVAIGLDPAGVTAVGAGTAQAATIANELTPPAGVTFSAPTTKASGLAPVNIPAGSVVAVWLRRTAANNAAVDLDGATISIGGDTAA